LSECLGGVVFLSITLALIMLVLPPRASAVTGQPGGYANDYGAAGYFAPANFSAPIGSANTAIGNSALLLNSARFQ